MAPNERYTMQLDKLKPCRMVKSRRGRPKSDGMEVEMKTERGRPKSDGMEVEMKTERRGRPKSEAGSVENGKVNGIGNGKQQGEEEDDDFMTDTEVNQSYVAKLTIKV